jgi:hypothetical protein
MAANKKSFILYTDLIHTVSKMPNDKAGELFKHILKYVNDENPETEDLIIQLTFEPIKQQLKRDLKDWESQRNIRSEAGKKGMLNRWNNKDNTVITEITKDNSVMQPITNITDNVTVTVNDTVNVNVNKRESNKSQSINFYKSEIENSKGLPQSENYERFVNYLLKINPTHIFAIRDQLSYEEFEKLKELEKSTGKSLKDKIDAFINDVKYSKGKVSVYLTLIKWLKS